MLNITINDTISFELERNTLAIEAFEALRCFTVSVHDNAPEPLVFAYAGPNGEILVRGSQDWKSLLENLVDNNVRLTIVGMENTSNSTDSEDESYEIISSTIGVESVSDVEEQMDTSPKKTAVNIEDEEEESDRMAIEDAVVEEPVENEPVVEEQPKQTANVSEESTNTEEAPKPMRGCELVRDFVKTVGKEDLQNMIAVTYSLVQEGCDLGDAIRSAVDTSEAAAAHPLMERVLPLVDTYAAKFTPWIGPLINLDLSIITQIVEPLMLCVQRTVDQGLDECELNLASVCSPEVIARLQRILPNGTERVYQVNPMAGPEECLRQAQENIEQDFNVTDVHRGITCDVCEMSPVRGNRWKCTVRSDYDLCDACEAKDTTGYPMIKIKANVGTERIRMPGLRELGQENKRKCGFGGRGRGRRGRCGGRWGGRGRGRGRGRRNGNCPFSQMKKHFREQMEKNGGNCPFSEMKKHFCEQMQKNSNQVNPEQQALHCCPQGHPLIKFHNDFPSMTCDVCSGHASTGDLMYGCRLCNFDKCPGCFGAAEEAEETDDMNITDTLREEKPKRKKCGRGSCHYKQRKKMCKEMKKMWKQYHTQQQEQKPPAPKPTKPYSAEVVDHLDLAEESVQNAGEMVLKTWKVMNNGTDTWGEDTIASFVKGSANLVVDSFAVASVGSLAPGDVAYIRVMFQVPTTPGRYFVTYRLFTPEQGKFGEKLRTTIIVEEEQEIVRTVEEEVVNQPKPAAVAPEYVEQEEEEEEESIESAVEVVEEEVQEEEPFQFQAALDQLWAIGFGSYLPEDELKAILVVVEGDVQSAVDMVLTTINDQ